MSSRMAGVDATWLHLDQPANSMVIHTVFLLEREPDWTRLAARFEELVARFPKLRQRPVEPLLPLGPFAAPSWLDQPDFRAGDCIDHIRLPAPGSVAQLDAYTAGQAAIAMPKDFPLWRATFVEGMAEGAALLLRTHHAIADGLSMLELIEALADPEEASSDAVPAVVAPKPRRRTVEVAASTVDIAFGLVDGGPPVLNQALSGRKHFGRLGPIPLASLKSVGRRCGATANDALMAMTAGALGRYLTASALPLYDLPVIMPVNVLGRDERVPGALGNGFGLSFVSLPTTAPPEARMAAIHARMQEIKASSEAFVTYRSIDLMGMAPATAQQLFIERFARGSRAITTNVVGPPRRLKIVGVALSNWLAWVPTAGRLGLGISFDSYAGEITVGVQADSGVVPDFALLMKCFGDELQDWQAVALS